MASGDEAVYQPKDAISATVRSTMIVGGAGLFLSAVQNSLTRQNVTGWGVITRTGGTIATFGMLSSAPSSRKPSSDWQTAAMGGGYEFARTAAANLREKDDSWNPTIGGFVGGSVGTFDYTGGRMTGFARDAEVDEYERKEQMRRNKRRPIEETLQELGEGRGIYGPGYQARRAERLKQRYGVDIPQPA
ncbi:MAG: hypothetical protein Q9168_000723 [Polycauliona sp. 1 TL-2023]